MQNNQLYRSFRNPLMINPVKSFPKKATIIGAGTIGPDIGYYLKSAMSDMMLVLIDVSRDALAKTEKRYEKYTDKLLSKGKINEDKKNQILSKITYSDDYNEVAGSDIVIESATENVDLKKKIFSTVEKLVSRDTVITSNTSSIPADRIFEGMQHKDRCTVTHFFAPAHRSLAVEVINWSEASTETLDYLCWLFAMTGKAPVITDNAICFMLDRIFDNWCNEAGYLLEYGKAAQVCKVAEEFAFQGPFYVLNMGNGNPIIVETNTLQMEEGAHYKPALIFQSVNSWEVPRPGTDVPVPEDLKNFIRDRLLGILFSQSFDIVDRGIGTREDLNFGCQVALGFRKGPLDIMADLGEAEVKRVIDKFVTERPGFPVPAKPLKDYQSFRRFLLVDDLDGVRVITIRRPQALNALTAELNEELLGVLSQSADDPAVQGFVITGYGTKAFSAGMDIGRFPSTLGKLEAATQYARECSNVLAFIDQMDKPVVAAVNGMALGGGLELAMRCEAIIAMAGSTMQFPEIKLGILPGAGGCVVPYRRWPGGAKQFHEMLSLAKSIGAAEAMQMGMVSAVAPDYRDMISVAVSKVHELKGRPRKKLDGRLDIPDMELPDEKTIAALNLSKEALGILRRTVRAGFGAETFGEALEVNYRGAGEIACSRAAAEGISAFLEKRKPDFSNL